METFTAYRAVRKGPGSYGFAREGRPGNPRSLHPDNYPAIENATFQLEDGSAKLLHQQDRDTISKVKRELRALGVRGHVSRLMVAGGGVGRGDHFTIRAGLRAGSIVKQGKGWTVVMRDFEV